MSLVADIQTSYYPFHVLTRLNHTDHISKPLRNCKLALDAKDNSYIRKKLEFGYATLPLHYFIQSYR